MKIKVGDTIKITIGKDRGKTGKVERVFPFQNAVVATGLNLYKKHTKARNNRPGEIIDVARRLPIGNISLVCPKCNKQTRVGYSVGKDAKKVRLCKKCGATI